MPSAPALPCDDVANLIPAHSIGATDPEEAAVVNTRLTACPQATAELAEYGRITEALLYAAPPQQAPARLAARLRTAIGAPPAIAPSSAVASPSVSPRFAAKRRKLSPFTLVTPTPKPPRRWSFGRFTATAAGLLLVALNLTLLVQNQQLRSRQEQLASILDQQNKALIFLAAEEPEEVVLSSAQENSDAQADVLWNSSLGIAVIYVRAFPELSPDQAYQIWLNKDDQRTSPGLFTVETGGMGIFVFPIQQPLDVYDTIGITPEPAGGSPGPTAPPVVRGAI
ncbi:MAG: anti-sigma factor [Caldilineaceae bacterium]